MHFIFDSNTTTNGSSPFISISPRGSSSHRREWNATPLSGRFVFHSDKQVARIRFDLVGATTILPNAEKRHLFQTIEVVDFTEQEGLIQAPFNFDVSSVPEDDIFSSILPPPTCSASHFKTAYTLHAYVTWADDSSPRRRLFRRSNTSSHISQDITLQYKLDENGTGFFSINKINSRASVTSHNDLSIEVPRGIRVNYDDGTFKTLMPDVGRSHVTKFRSDAEQLPVVSVRGAQDRTLRLILVEETHLLYVEPNIKLNEVIWRSEDVHGNEDVTNLTLPNGIKVCPDFETGQVKVTHVLKIESYRTGHPLSSKTQSSTRIKVVSEGSVGADAMDEAWSFEAGAIDDPPPAYYVASPENGKLPRRDVMFGNQNQNPTQRLEPCTPDTKSVDPSATAHSMHGRYDTVTFSNSSQTVSELFSSSPTIITPRAATPRIGTRSSSSPPLSTTQAPSLPSSPTPNRHRPPAKRQKPWAHNSRQQKAEKLSSSSPDSSADGPGDWTCPPPSSPSPQPSRLGDRKKSSEGFSLPSGLTVACEKAPVSSKADNQLRALPPHVESNLDYPRFYSLFKRPSMDINPLRRDGRVYNRPRSPNDLYTPQWTKGVGDSKVGLCPICPTETWFKMKVSAFWYHMNFYHGISPNGQPYSPPLQFRRTEYKPKKSTGVRVTVTSGGAVNAVVRTVFVEGKCHRCKKWIKLEGPREGSVNVVEIYWWKHASSCHKGSRIPGDDKWFASDDEN